MIYSVSGEICMMMDLGAVFSETALSMLAGRHANVRKKKSLQVSTLKILIQIGICINSFKHS